MDCTHCEPALLDLCYGELTLAQERDVRAHISECPTCKKALSRLEAGQALARHLPDEAPPHELTERILRDAQAHLRRRGTPLERFQGYLESMARIAMTRQVAMATLSLLIVFVGLWSIPELTHRREARTAMVVESTSHDGEAGPSRELAASPVPAAAPAALPEKEQKQLGRAARTGAAVPESSAREQAATVAAKRAERADKGRGAASSVAQRPQSKAEARRRRFAEPPPEPTRAAEPADVPALAEADRELLARGTPVPAAAAAPAASAEARQAPVGAASGLADSRDNLLEEKLAAKPAAPATLEDVFQAGVERYRAEDYAAAAQLFARMLESSAPSAQRAAALLFLARSERELGRCDRAIRAYETLVRSYGSAQQSANALLEGVECFDQLGDAAGAQRLLDHAASVPSLSAQAAKLAHDRSGKKAAETSGDAPPAP